MLSAARHGGPRNWRKCKGLDEYHYSSRPYPVALLLIQSSAEFIFIPATAWAWAIARWSVSDLDWFALGTVPKERRCSIGCVVFDMGMTTSRYLVHVA